MRAGDYVWYLQTCRGGYGYQRRGPAVFVRQTDRRVVIEVLTRAGQWKKIAVRPCYVTERATGEAIEVFR